LRFIRMRRRIVFRLFFNTSRIIALPPDFSVGVTRLSGQQVHQQKAAAQATQTQAAWQQQQQKAATQAAQAQRFEQQRAQMLAAQNQAIWQQRAAQQQAQEAARARWQAEWRSGINNTRRNNLFARGN
jgi:preprotein translocase subunit SecF